MLAVFKRCGLIGVEVEMIWHSGTHLSPHHVGGGDRKIAITMRKEKIEVRWT